MRKTILLCLLLTFCLSGCANDMKPMYEDNNSINVELSDEQKHFMANTIEFTMKHPCFTGPIMPMPTRLFY